MGFIGTDQHHDLDEILRRARKFIADGHRVQIERVEFSGERGREHPHPFEFELYVDFQSLTKEQSSKLLKKKILMKLLICILIFLIYLIHQNYFHRIYILFWLILSYS